MDIQGFISGIVFSAIVLIYSYFFVSGIWQESEKQRFNFLRRYSTVIHPDILLGELPRDVVVAADLLAFWICLIFSILILLAGFLAPRICGILWIAGMIAPWPARVFLILKYKNGKIPPRFWPYKYK